MTSAAAVSIAKVATVMMKVAMVKVVAAAVSVMLAVGIGAVAVAEQPAPTATEPAAPGEPAPLHGRVVLAEKPETAVAKAIVSGLPVAQDESSRGATSDESGNFQIPHSASNMYLVVQTADQKLGAVVLVKPEEENIVVHMVPTTSAHGRLLDADGKPMPNQTVIFGITMERPAPPRPVPGAPPRVRNFNAGAGGAGGAIKTGDDGTFSIKGLVPGQEYDLATVVPALNGARRIYPLEKIKSDSAKPMDLGDLSVRPATKPATRPAASE